MEYGCNGEIPFWAGCVPMAFRACGKTDGLWFCMADEKAVSCVGYKKRAACGDREDRRKVIGRNRECRECDVFFSDGEPNSRKIS